MAEDGVTTWTLETPSVPVRFLGVVGALIGALWGILTGETSVTWTRSKRPLSLKDFHFRHGKSNPC